VVCQHDVVKFMLQKLILSGRLGKWAYSLVEFDLAHEPLKAMRGPIVTNFIVDHAVAIEDEVCMVEAAPWKLFFDGLVCSKGRGVGYVLVSPNNIPFYLSVCLEFACTNNQAEYGAILYGLELFWDIGGKERRSLW
jgi:hypothetical protein